MIAYGFVCPTGPTGLLGQLVTRVVTPWLAQQPRLVPGLPKRFAQGIGAVLSVSAAVLALLGLHGAADALLGALAVAATPRPRWASAWGAASSPCSCASASSPPRCASGATTWGAAATG